MGNSGVTNFGFISFAAIGAYSSAILTVPTTIKSITIPDAPLGLSAVHLGFGLGLLAGVAFTAVVATGFGLALTRQVGIATEIATLAMLVIVHVILINWGGDDRGSPSVLWDPYKHHPSNCHRGRLSRRIGGASLPRLGGGTPTACQS